ncbi:hypothetical protein ACP275_14G200700 [Erythranthe tilingii]
MCIAVFMWQAHPLYPFLLLLNRDEYHNRPTKPVGWWEGGEILGGKDEVAGGTWLACSKHGRVGYLTNVLELHTLPEAKSRGDLVVRFLESEKCPKAFAEELVKEANQYNGFNLIVADLASKSMVYVTNRPKGDLVPIPGIHVLSNATLNTPWPKAERLLLNFKLQVKKYCEGEISVKEMVEKLIKACCRIYVHLIGKNAALTVKATGESSFYKTYLKGGAWKQQTFKYRIKKLY